MYMEMKSWPIIKAVQSGNKHSALELESGKTFK